MSRYGAPWLLIKYAWKSKNLKPSAPLKIVVFITKFCLSLPFMLYEHILLSRRITSTPISPAPIFILGHYRSGTTFLHKLLARDAHKAVIRNYDLLFPFHPRWLQKICQPLLQAIINWAQLKQVAFNDLPYSLEDPNEDDILFIHYLSSLSAYWGYLFPHRAQSFFRGATTEFPPDAREKWQEEYAYQLKKVQRKNGNQRLVLKSPPHTGRIPLLLELFPDAHFIYLHRDPIETFYSVKKLWSETLYPTFALEDIQEAEQEDIILAHYQDLIRSYEEGKALIPAGQLIEVKYDELMEAPLAMLKRLYDQWDIGDFEEQSASFRAQLHKERNYVRSSYAYDERTLTKVRAHWGEWQ
jgi:hypothetical protein